MFLKKINVHGFKSFADKTEIIVEKGMTAIVGPNGSGKSNISDSIKWVLGEQSPKTLRGSKMEDIIFAGTQKRMPLGYADVELIFDNESGKLPIDYKEVSIKRRLFRTGESEYSINKKACRLKDIRELFMDTGIGKDGYSVIGQGKVEEILSPNSEVRRGVFEEAAGIVKYKARKEESIRKLEKTNDNLDRVNDIIHELEIRVEPLKEESEKATKYLKLKDSLKNIELNLYVRDYEKNKEQLDIFQNQRDEALKGKELIVARRNDLEKLLTNKNEEISSLENEIRTLEKGLSSINKNYEEKKNIINVQKEKINLYSHNVGSIQGDIEALEKAQRDLEAKIQSFNQDIANLEEEIKAKQEEYNKANEACMEFKIKMDASISASDSKKNDLFEMHKTSNKLQSDINSLESIKESYIDRIKDFEREIELESGNLKSRKEELKEVNSEKLDNDSRLGDLNKKYDKFVEEAENLKVDKEGLEDSLKEANNQLNTAQSRISFLNNMESLYEGYFKSVQTLMSLYKKEGLFKGAILGTVADVIKTDKEFETAIDISLGSAIQNVIVNNTMDAEAIINYLKENQIGRVTFLPITSIKPREFSKEEQQYLSMPGVVDTADKLVEVDLKYSNIIKSLLGKTLVVETIRDGFRIAKACNNTIKIVSLQGEVINPGGAVTGGHISSKSSNLLSRKREIDESKDKLESLTKKCKNIEDDIREVELEYLKANREINILKDDIDSANNKKMQIDNRISLLSEQITKIEEAIGKYSVDKDYVLKESEKRASEIEQVKGQITEISGKIEALESEINDITNASKEDKEIYDKMSQELNDRNNQLQSIRQEIVHIEDKIGGAKEDISKNQHMIETKRELLNNTDTEIESAKVEVEKLEEDCVKIKGNIEEREQEIAKQRQAYYKFKEIVNSSSAELNSLNKKITEGIDDEYNLKMKIEKINFKLEDISKRLWDEYEMSYAMALSYKNEDVSFSKVNNDVSVIRRQIKSLGDVNVNSINEYKEVKERYDFLTKQRKDLNDAKNQLNDVIKELEIKMRDQFVEEFAKIRVIFNDVFTDLFNGGKADVYLEDENDALNSGIEIAAQPPGKKLSKITLLSGGEKALTAIALLFSILKTKPTSFCILDEIEAALDDVNVYRFSRYLKEFSKETQFLCITHRKGTMESADTLYGTTMEEKGVTKLVSVRLSDVS